MKKYRFRLESVRRVRQTQEDLAKNNLALANSEVNQAISAVEERLVEYQHRTDSQLGTVGVDSFMKHRYFNDLASRAVLNARIAQRNAEDRAAVRHQEWSEAAKNVKALDRLDERRRDDYNVEASRELASEVDDIVTARYSRRDA